VLEHIVKNIPVPKRILNQYPFMIVIRSFDVNKPGTEIDKLKGGVLGGCILRGILKEGDEIEIRPGRTIENDSTRNIFKCQPIRTIIKSIRVEEENELKFAIPGGLIGLGTLLDPCLTKSNALSGNVIG